MVFFYVLSIQVITSDPCVSLCSEHSMAETLTVAMRVAEEAIDEAISKAEFDTASQVIYVVHILLTVYHHAWLVCLSTRHSVDTRSSTITKRQNLSE